MTKIHLPSPLLHYFDRYSAAQAPFMHQQLIEWVEKKPLTGLRVIHHVPLCPNTLLKIACLVASGAEVTVTNPSFTPAHPDAVACLKKSQINYEENLYYLRGEKFDLYFDCGAELYQALGRPNLGAIELTSSGDQYYRNQSLDFPVLSVDRSLTKQLETIFGSSESVISAIDQLKKIHSVEKSWMIFGFGKIGRGVAYGCVKNKSRVVIVDPALAAKTAGQSLQLAVIDSQNKEAIQEALEKSDIIVTATGIKSLLSAYPHDWFEHKILANMGVYDEYGASFSPKEVLNDKKPVNFVLDDPTAMKYIDPEFYAHNIAAMPFLTQSLSIGVNDFSSELDHEIIHRWCHYHKAPFTEIEQWFISF